MRSFNFDVDSISSYEHLRNQFYNVCVRRNKKYCKIGWSQSTDSNSFKVHKTMHKARSALCFFGASQFGFRVTSHIRPFKRSRKVS